MCSYLRSPVRAANELYQGMSFFYFTAFSAVPKLSDLSHWEHLA